MAMDNKDMMDRYNMLEKKMADKTISEEERDELMSLRTQMSTDSGM
jgi:uncharacterized protein YnzC (UPF0291/DUF896 family)